MIATAAAGFTAASKADPACCAIVELRQYDMQPGRRDTLIDMFDTTLLDAQEAAGNTVMGQFRDVDRPDRFVWFRGFASMEARPKALDGFYTSATWQRHRNAANATMIDVSDVLLLQPLTPTSGLTVGKRPTDEAATGLVEVTIYPFEAAAGPDLLARAHRDLTEAGATATAAYVTERSANNYPRLPIRENENVLVRISTFASERAYNADRAALYVSRRWQALRGTLRSNLVSEPQILRLSPTRRSLTHG